MDFEIDDPNDDLLLSPIKHKKKEEQQNLSEIDDDLQLLEEEEDDDENNSMPKLKHDDRKSELEMQCMMLNNSNTLKESLSMLSVRDEEKGEITKELKYIKILDDSFDDIYPLFYLNNEQRKRLHEKITITKFNKKTLLYSGIPELIDNGNDACFILLDGEVHIYNNKQIFIDLITEVTLFGYDGPIFNKRISTAIVEKDSVLGVLSKNDFLELLQPFSQFATFISRNIRYKDKVLDSLNSFRNFVLSSIDKGPIDLTRLLKLYQKFQPCLHPKCNSEEIDFQAWIYALNRLPHNIFETFVYVLINKPPKLLALSNDLTQKLLPKQKSSARNRDIYKYLDGKSLVVVRDLETDVLDFVCNLCIYIIESTKIRKHIYSPIVLKELNKAKGNFKETIQILHNHGIEIGLKEQDKLFKIVGDDFSEKLSKLCINYLDISLSITKSPLSGKDPIELWTQHLWKVTKKVLGINTWLTDIKDLVVDIFQGSRRTLLNCISPHLYFHKDEILAWAKKEKIQLKTKKFHTERDELIAYAYYYYQNFPEKEKEKREMNKQYGIEIVERTFGTSVHIIVINLNKLIKIKEHNIDLGFDFKPASKNHIIVHIGYTFGNQSHDLIKPVLMLYGPKLRSFNLLGKCGGLIGKQSDVMVATRHFLSKTHDVVSVKGGEIDPKELAAETGANVHVGPFITVAGTILQNVVLLKYYKVVMGCVGLDMEGYYYVREIENSIKHKLLNESFIMRCLYYVLDVPTDPNQILTKENMNDHWEEGISALNASERYLLKAALKE